jgi:predicted AAA+ superfamily ATPase
MDLSDVIQQCELLQARLIAAAPVKMRLFCETLNPKARGIIFTGARGVGKTTYLLQLLKHKHMLYIPADHPVIGSAPLYDLCEGAFLKGYDGVCIDEVHYAKDWPVHLKGIYDSFPGKEIRASGSSVVILKKGISDLSRRFVYISLPLLSLREFIALTLGTHIERLDPFEASTGSVEKIMKAHNILKIFESYSRHGFRPIFSEGTEVYTDKVMNTIFKSLDEDIPFLVPQVSSNHLRLMRAVLGYIGTSSVPRLNVSNLCAEWGLGKDKLYQLLEAMERAHVIRIVRHKTDHAVHSKGAKIFFHEPSLYRTFVRHDGNFRESFAVCAFSEAGKTVWACKNEQDGDFTVDDTTIEIGGRKKTGKGAAFLICEDIDFPVDNRLPLWILGCIW